MQTIAYTIAKVARWRFGEKRISDHVREIGSVWVSKG